MPSPIKRHVALQPTSREHHYGLLLSWKIREGFRLKIDPERMKKYTDWFWKNHLEPHFAFEEAFIFPIMGKDHPSVRRAKQEHARLRRLFNKTEKVERSLHLIEEELTAHIRFEERILFNEVQELATEEQLQLVEEAHSGAMPDDWYDEFWSGEKHQ